MTFDLTNLGSLKPIPMPNKAQLENMIKKNRNHFPIAVLLTTLICSHKMNVDLFLWFTK
jgi:hypothetical protein